MQANDPFESLLRDPSQGRQHIESILKVVPLPESRAGLQREIRFNMAFCQANRLNQTAKWLGELLVTVQSEPAAATRGVGSKVKTGSSTDDQVMSGDSSFQNEVFSDKIEDHDMPSGSRPAFTS